MDISEKVLGRRVVNYLRNEALVGRISNQKLKVKKIMPNFLKRGAYLFQSE